VGQREVAGGTVGVKDLAEGTQDTVDRHQVVAAVRERLA